MFLNDLEHSGLSVLPSARTITYVSGVDESAIDYWLGNQRIHFLDVSVGASLLAQHRPVRAQIKVDILVGQFIFSLIVFLSTKFFL
jgi:hypothetical protein